ncbi:hypothetical protein SUGI_0486140 [Cryptomeria japonica]|nr:hypothetical protein SUGI_0486140 [Cryptomeria japonica]
MMSERWSSGKPTKISVTTSHNFDDYLKSIEFMYGEHVYFSNIEECLAILSVASELLADDPINKCKHNICKEFIGVLQKKPELEMCSLVWD